MREKTINVVFFFCAMSGHYEPDHSKLGNYLKVETVTTTQSLPTPSLAMTLKVMLAITRKNTDRI